MSNPKSRNLIVLLVVAIIIAVTGVAVAKYSPDFNRPAAEATEATAATDAQTNPESATPETAAADEEAEDDNALHGTDEGEAEEDVAVAAAETAPATTATEAAPVATAETKPGDVNVVVTAAGPADPRVIGKADAPVTMTEFSSLTCPHCAAAHEEILPVLIKEYVEPGKLKIVMSDFPLNKQALDASKLSRCVSTDQYWGFVTLLFSNIGAWAEGADYPSALIQNAQLTGLSKEKAEACLADQDIETALMLKVQEASQRFKIGSTPTFVFNDGVTTIKGTQDIGVFRKAIDDLLAQQ